MAELWFYHLELLQDFPTLWSLRSPGASKRGGQKSGSGGRSKSSSKQGGTTAQKKAAGRKGGKAAAKKR